MILQDRKTELQKIYRYNGFTENMFFRPNLEIHTKRVVLVTEYICDMLQKRGVSLDTKYITALAYMHDDDEFITGDFVSGRKLNFNQEEQKKYETDCKNAIDILVENYGDNFMGYSYRTLLEDNNTGTSLEYKIVDLADKLDAHGEVCHEIFNGNKEFLKNNLLPGHGEIPVYDFTRIRVGERVKRLEKATQVQIPILGQRVDSYYILGKSLSSSEEDLLSINTKCSFYDTWIQLQLANFGKKDLERLYIRSNGNVS